MKRIKKQGDTIVKIMVYSFNEEDERAFFDELCSEAGVEYVTCPDYPSLDNAHLAQGCEAIRIQVCDMNRKLIRALHAQGVRYICTRSIGTDHIDMNAVRELGMRASHAVYSPESVANYAIMLMLMCCRKLPYVLDRAKLQDFSLQGKRGRELSKMTVGVIGLGRIGRTVLRHLSGFGCRLMGYDVFVTDEAKMLCEVTDLDAIYRECDVITLHCPATADNHHMINAEAIAKMKPGVMIINTARGNLVDSEALISALEDGKIGAVAVDVLENEYGLYYMNRMGDAIANRELALLSSFPNVIVSPHTAFYTDVSIRDMAQCTVEAACAFARGEETPFEVK